MGFESKATGRPVAVVGIGGYTPLGNSIQSSFDAILEGKHGLSVLPEELKYDDLDVSVAGILNNVEQDLSQANIGIDRPSFRRSSKSTLLAIYAIRQAMEQGGIRKGNGIALADTIDSERVGYSIGSGASGANLFSDIGAILHHNDQVKNDQLKNSDEGKIEKVKGDLIFSVLPERMATLPSMLSGETDEDGPTGPTIALLGACAAGNYAIAIATDMIRQGKADIMIAGGTEAQINREALTMFRNLTALDTSKDPDYASLPFGKDGNGFVMSEGAGILVLEDVMHAQKRGANILAVIAGTGYSGDGTPGSSTMMNPKGPAKAMREALKEGSSWDNLWIKAHATGTSGDGRELEAFGRVLSPVEVHGVSSLKGQLGHTIGASGAIEAALVVEGLRRGIMLPNRIVGDLIADASDWPIVRQPEEIRGRLSALLNSFGFGGINASLYIEQPR